MLLHLPRSDGTGGAVRDINNFSMMEHSTYSYQKISDGKNDHDKAKETTSKATNNPTNVRV